MSSKSKATPSQRLFNQRHARASNVPFYSQVSNHGITKAQEEQMRPAFERGDITEKEMPKR